MNCKKAIIEEFVPRFAECNVFICRRVTVQRAIGHLLSDSERT